MCRDDSYSDPYPPLVIGGPTGDYFVVADVPDCRWAEYRVLLATNGDVAGAAALVVSDKKPIALKYDGSQTLNNDAHLYGQAIRLGPTITQPLIEDWIRITNSEKKVFVRIDAQATCSAYVTLQFRIKRLEVVPGPSHEVHPDHMQNLNQARAKTTTERLKALGIPGYAEEE